MGEAAEAETQAHDAGTDDHHGGKERVTREHGHVLAAGHHHRQNQRRLDGSHREGEDERAEGFADAVGHDFRVMHRHEDRGPQRDAAQRGDPRSHAR